MHIEIAKRSFLAGAHTQAIEHEAHRMKLKDWNKQSSYLRNKFRFTSVKN